MNKNVKLLVFFVTLSMLVLIGLSFYDAYRSLAAPQAEGTGEETLPDSTQTGETQAAS